MVSVAVIVAIAVTILANLLADRKFTRIDLTKEGRYSLSDPFKRILGRLEERAAVTYYISSQVPAGFLNYRQAIIDKLKEVENISGGKIKLEIIDPGDNPELSKRLTEAGAKLQAPDVKKEAVTFMNLFTCIEIVYQEKPRVLIPRIEFAEEVEYLLGGKIIELTTEKKPVIAVQAPPAPQNNPMTGGGMGGSGYEYLQQGQWEGGDRFDVRAVDLTEGNSIPDNARLLILIRPRNLNERQQYEVQKFLAEGGNVLMLASPFKVAYERTWHAEQTPTGLEEYLKSFGVTFGSDFVADNSNLRLPLRDRYGFPVKDRNGQIRFQRNPLFVRILSENVNQELVLTRYMPGLLMPSPAEIKFKPETLKSHGLNEIVLAKTSKKSWSVNYMDVIDTESLENYDEERQIYDGSKNVFVMLKGQFPFSFEGKPIPEWRKSSEPSADKPAATASASRKPGCLVLCSAPESFHQMYMMVPDLARDIQGNAAMLVNVAESLTLGDDLIQLRTKQYETRTIDKLAGNENDAKRNAVKFLLTVGVPLLIVVAALIRAALRRDAQTRYERRFAATGPSSFTP